MQLVMLLILSTRIARNDAVYFIRHCCSGNFIFFFNQKYFIDLMSWAYVKFGRYGVFVSAVMLSATFVTLYVTCIVLWPVAFLYTIMKA